MKKLDELMKKHRPQIKTDSDQAAVIWQKIENDAPYSLWKLAAGVTVSSLALFFILQNSNNFNYEQNALNLDDLSLEESYAVSDWESLAQ